MEAKRLLFIHLGEFSSSLMVKEEEHNGDELHKARTEYQAE